MKNGSKAWVMENTRLGKSMKMPTRPLGKTGHDVSLFSLGGQGSLENNPDDRKGNIEIVRRAFDLGVNYFDTSPIYGPKHASELVYGEALEDVRGKAFIATKTHNRSYDASMSLLESSLKRLRTDHVDLWQLHSLENEGELDQIFGARGAMKALLKMQDEGAVRHLGITGHWTPGILAEAMRRHDFDTVLCSVNAADRHVKPSFIDTLLPDAKRRGMGVVGMKVFSQGWIFEDGGIKTKWEPLSYVLSQDVSTVITGVDDIEQLEENVAIAKSFEPMDEDMQKKIEAKTKKYIRQAQFFRSKFGGYGTKYDLPKPYFERKGT